MAGPPPDVIGGLQKYTSLFTKSLNHDSLTNRAPRRFHAAWTEAHANCDVVAKLFLRCGFAAWLAYLYTKRNCEGVAHYGGKSTDKAALSDFLKLSETDQTVVATDVATDVARMLRSQAVDVEKLQRLAETPPRRRKRDTLRGDQSTLTVNPITTTPHPHVPPPIYDVPSSEVAVFSTPSAIEHDSGIDPMPIAPDGGDVYSRQTTPMAYTFPKSANLRSLFLGHLYGAIRKMGDTSDVQIQWPTAEDELDGVVHLAIKHDQLAFIASQLFGVNIGRDGPQRYMIGENGVKIVPKPSLELDRAAANDITAFFSEEVLRGIEESTMRKNEVLEGTPATETKCLKLEMSCKADDCAYLHIIKGLNGLFSVYARCFPGGI